MDKAFTMHRLSTNRMITVRILIWLGVVRFADSADQSQCMQSILLNRHRIPSSAFTATSEQVEPAGGRRYSADSVRAENADLAWCPSKRVGVELDEFVQVDMGELNAVTKLVISGLLAESGGYRFSPFFYVRYKREWTEPDWRIYRKFFPSQTSQLVGSHEPLVPKFVVLDPPLIARWIRIYPYRDPPGFVCIRLEAYGCRFTDDLVEYQIPEGSVSVPSYHAPPPPPRMVEPSPRPSDNRTHYYRAGGGTAFSDICYDGYRVEPGSLLDGGLGCLTDLSVAAQSTTPIPRSSAVDTQAHMFVGWHRSRWLGGLRSGNDNDVVDMRFRFATVRRFQQLKLFTSNNYMEKIRLPKRIEVRFSVGGVQFSGQPAIVQNFSPDNRTKGVLSLELDLNNRIGQFVQLKVFFADDWLLLSEISFTSHVSTDPAMPEDSLSAPRSSKQHTTLQPPVSSGISAEVLEFPGRLWPTVIVLIVLIVLFLSIIGLTCIRLCWKRNYWQTPAKSRNPYQSTCQNSDPVLIDGLLNTNNPNQIVFSPAGTLLKASSFGSPDCFSLSHDTTRLQSIGTIPNCFPNQAAMSDKAPDETNPVMKTTGLIFPSPHPSERLSNRLFDALCPGRRLRLRSRVSTSTPPSSSDSATQHSRSRSVTDTDSQGHVHPYSTVSNVVSTRIDPVENFKVYPNGSVMHDGREDWFFHPSTCTNNSTSLAFFPGVQSADVNLYTSVVGESDVDSNGASTMSPEYASTNPVWAAALMHHPSVQQRNSFLAINPSTPAALSTQSHRNMPNSVTFNGLDSNAYHSNSFHQPFVYFNPGVPSLAPTDAEAFPLYNQVPFPTASTVPTVYFSPTFGPSSTITPADWSFVGSPSPNHVSQKMNALALESRPLSTWIRQMREKKRATTKSPMEKNRSDILDVNSNQPDPQSGGISPWHKANFNEIGDASSENTRPPTPPSPPPPPPPAITTSRPKLLNPSSIR